MLEFNYDIATLVPHNSYGGGDTIYHEGVETKGLYTLHKRKKPEVFRMCLPVHTANSF